MSGLAGIVGGGASRVGISAAMRARDVSRPRPGDIAAAEQDLDLRGHAPHRASPASVPPHPPVVPALPLDQPPAGAD